MVVSGETSNESSEHVSNHRGVQFKVATVCSSKRSFDWSDCKDAESCELLSSFEILLVVPFVLEGADVRGDLRLVQGVVGGQLSCKLGWVLEDRGPVFNCLNVIAHTFAGVESLWDLSDGESKLKSSLDVIVGASLLDVSDSGSNFLFHEFSTLEAGLNLSEVVLSGHTFNKSSDEVWNCHGGDVNVSEHFVCSVWKQEGNFLFNNNNLVVRST